MANELIFLTTILVAFGFVLFSFYLGRRWLYAAIVINLILIGVFGAKLVELFGSVTNVGNIFYVAVFFAGQLLVEHFGKREAKRSVWIGLVGVAFFTLMGQLTIALVSIPETAGASAILDTLFDFAPRITIASLLAYMLSQTVNIYTYSLVSKLKPKAIWLRSIIASTAGQFFDSIIFFSIAFVGTVAGSVVIKTATTGFAAKVIVGAMSIPLIYLSYRIKTRREILEEESEAILESIGEGIVVADKNGRILTVNRRFEELIGRTPEEVVGERVTDVLRREDASGKFVSYEDRVLARVLAGEKVESQTYNHTYFVKRDGTRFPVRVVVTPIRIDHKIMGAVELFADVTEEQRMEKMRTDFLALASHQLRTPLSGTRWVIETLRRGLAGEMNEKQMKYLNHLYTINSQLVKMASDTLNILRMERGEFPTDMKSFAIPDLIREAVREMSMATKDKNITIEIPKDIPPVAVYSDLFLAESILVCFISNAISYSPPGSKIELGIKEVADDVVISVKDNGIGIPKDEQERIFEKFYRATNAKLMVADGTGLGLSISHMVAEKIGATVNFRSEEGKGSTFSLHLPKSSLK